jgi:hypothetical protein
MEDQHRCRDCGEKRPADAPGGWSRVSSSAVRREFANHQRKTNAQHHEIHSDFFVDFMVTPLRCVRTKPKGAARDVQGFRRRQCRHLSADQLRHLVALLQTLK